MFALLWTSLVPAVVSLLLNPTLFDAPVGQGEVGFLILSVGTFLLVIVTGFFWAWALRHFDRADQFLRDPLRTAVVAWMLRLYRTQWRGWLVSAVAFAALWLFVPDLRAFYPTDPGRWIAAIQFVVAVGSVSHLAWAFPDITRRIRYARPGELRFLELDPLSTPAVRLLVGLMTVGSLLLLAVLVLQTIAWFLLRGSDPSASVSWAFTIGVGIVLAAIVRAAVIPTFELRSWAVGLKTERLLTLDEVFRRKTVELTGTSMSRDEVLADRTDAAAQFFQVLSLEDGPYRASTVIQYGATMLGVVLAYLLSWILPRLS